MVRTRIQRDRVLEYGRSRNMIKKLKTWDQFEAEFKPLADVWKEYEYGYEVEIKYNNMRWYINSLMRDFFGTEIEVEKIKYYKRHNYTHNYTHRSMGNGKIYGWHELWFEPEFVEFLSEEEVEI